MPVKVILIKPQPEILRRMLEKLGCNVVAMPPSLHEAQQALENKKNKAQVVVTGSSWGFQTVPSQLAEELVARALPVIVVDFTLLPFERKKWPPEIPIVFVSTVGTTDEVEQRLQAAFASLATS